MDRMIVTYPRAKPKKKNPNIFKIDIPDSQTKIKPVKKKTKKPLSDGKTQTGRIMRNNFDTSEKCKCTICEKDTLNNLQVPIDHLIHHADIIPDKIYNFGERGSGFHSRYPVQNYNIIKAECLKNEELFEDNTFNMYLGWNKRAAHVEWLRPHEYCTKNKLSKPEFMGDIDRFSVNQGSLGDCWLLASMAVLTLSDKHFVQVIPSGQSFDKDYAGIFHFRLWSYGRWIDVCVDDRLPCVYGLLLFAHPHTEHCFWSCLLEKAVAKLWYGYHMIDSGTGVDGLEMFTGGCGIHVPKKDNSIDVCLRNLKQGLDRGSIIVAAIFNPKDATSETELGNGLFGGHCYSVINIVTVWITNKYTKKEQKVDLIRIRNPWGNAKEWKGAWSDNSREWDLVSKKKKKQIGVVFKPDGEFWMDFKDCYEKFDDFEMLLFCPKLYSDLDVGTKKQWHFEEFEGEWLPGVTSGGGVNVFKDQGIQFMLLGDNVHLNPQYLIVLRNTSDDDDDYCTLIVELSQKSQEMDKKNVQRWYNIMLFLIPMSKDCPRPLTYDYIEEMFSEDNKCATIYDNKRKVREQFFVKSGAYCIIPATEETTIRREFYLRVITESPCVFKKYDKELKYQRNVVKDVINIPAFVKSYGANNLRKIFFTMIDENEEIFWYNLRHLINQFLKVELRAQEISKSTCQSLVALLDFDYSGSLNFEEFEQLINYLFGVKNIFRDFDPRNRGFLNSKDLNKIFNKFKMPMNKRILTLITLRYGDANFNIHFDDFIQIFIKMAIIPQRFACMPRKEDKITLNLEDWLTFTLYS